MYDPQIPSTHVVQFAPKPVIPGRGLATAGMTLGIVAWSIAVLSFFLLSPLSLVLSIVGMPMSLVGYSQANAVRAPKGMAVAGIALNGVGLAIAGLLLGFTLLSAVVGFGASA